MRHVQMANIQPLSWALKLSPSQWYVASEDRNCYLFFGMSNLPSARQKSPRVLGPRWPIMAAFRRPGSFPPPSPPPNPYHTTNTALAQHHHGSWVAPS